MFQASIQQGLQFLTELFHDKDTPRGYNAINTARSALSSILSHTGGTTFGENFYVKKFMKGIHNMKPPTPRYSEIWDVNIVVEYLQKLSPAKSLSLLQLSQKVVVLFLIVSAQRAQVIPKLNIDNMEINDDSVTFYLKGDDLKQGRIGYKPQPIKIQSYPDRRLCCVHYIKKYLRVTLDNRGKYRELFLTTTKPHCPVSRDTVSRWVKSIMRDSGVDTTVFKPGSTRAASVSKADREGIPIDEVLKAGGWTRETTFTRFYKKTITNKRQFSQVVLKSNKGLKIKNQNSKK